MIPSSGEELPCVGLGTWIQFDVSPQSTQIPDLKKVLEFLVEMGGSVVDSSPMYGNSEKIVGMLADELGITDRIFFATKVWTSGKQTGIRQMENSMELFRTNQIELMQVHNLVDWQTHFKTMRAWKDAGKIKYIGITHYVESAYDTMERIMKNEKPDFIQLNYSIVSRTAEERILPLAQDLGIATIINSPFEGGGLFRRIRGKQLPSWVKSFDCNYWSQFFLKYILANPAVTCVIPGTSNPDHLKENVGAGYGRLPNQKERERMVEFLS